MENNDNDNNIGSYTLFQALGQLFIPSPWNCCLKARGSDDQVLFLFHKEEFKGKANSKQESMRFIKAKVHTQGEGVCAHSRERM